MSAEIVHHPRVLDNDSIQSFFIIGHQVALQLPHLAVLQQSVDREVDVGTVDVGIAEPLPEKIFLRIFRVSSGAELPAADIDRVGAGVHRCPERVQGTGRSKQLRDLSSVLSCLSVSHHFSSSSLTSDSSSWILAFASFSFCFASLIFPSAASASRRFPTSSLFRA